jgi:hypothetical protein
MTVESPPPGAAVVPAPPAPRAGTPWLSVLRRVDPGELDRTVRHTQHRLLNHLVGALELPLEVALDLTHRVLLEALETVATARGGSASPLARLDGTARILLRKRLRAALGTAAGMDGEYEPEPDPTTLRGFYDGDPELDERLAARTSLPPFLALAHDALRSLPPGPPDGLAEVAGTLLLAHARPNACMVFDEHLHRAGWIPGAPLTEVTRQRLLHHVNTCQRCVPCQGRAVQRVRTLPPVVVPAVLGLDAQRRQLFAAVGSAPDLSTEAPRWTEQTALMALVDPPPAPPPPPARDVRPEPVGFGPRVMIATLTIGLLIVVGLAVLIWAASRTDQTRPTALTPTDTTPVGTPTVSVPATTAAPPVRTSRPAPPTPTPTPTATSPSATRTSTSTPPPRPPSPPRSTVKPPPPRTTTPPAPPPPSTPTRRLSVGISSFSSGSLAVTIAGEPQQTCTGGHDCTYQMHSGDTVVLDPADFVLSWSGTPCAGASTSSSCVFTASGNDSMSLVVLHFR